MKKTKICLSRLPRGVAENVKNLENDLPLLVCNDGIMLEAEKSDRFAVQRSENAAKIFYTKENEIYAGIKYLFIGDGHFFLHKRAKMQRLCAMIDCSRNAVKNTKALKKIIRILAFCGYNSLMLYTEDTYEVEGEPYFGYLRGRYTKDEIKELDAYAQRYGIELIPCIQTLAHLRTLRYWAKEYDRAIDSDDVLFVGEERTYTLIENIFRTLQECFTCKKINIGMDEAWGIGRGKYLTRHGYEPSISLMKKHLEKIVEIAQKYGFEPCMWSDMFLRSLSKNLDYYNLEPIPKELYEAVPQGVGLIYWDYTSDDKEHYKTHIDRHLSFGRELFFAGSSYTSYRFSADNELGIERMSASFAACEEKGVKNYIVTLWGDDGGESSMFSALGSLVKVGCMNYGDDESEYEKTLGALCGLSRCEFSSIFLQKDKYLFYNDCFTGVYDTSIDFGESEKYKIKLGEIEKAIKKATAFKNIFVTKKRYYEAMLVKCELGLQTRAAYRSPDKKRLKKLIARYALAIQKTQAFYESFKKDWLYENKPYGLEIQSVRMGGLVRRLQDCRERLIMLFKGRIDKIEELEYDLLDYSCKILPTHEKPANVVYAKAVSVNPL